MYVAALVFYCMFLFWCKHTSLFLHFALLHFTDNAFLFGFLFCFLHICFLHIEGLCQMIAFLSLLNIISLCSGKQKKII